MCILNFALGAKAQRLKGTTAQRLKENKIPIKQVSAKIEIIAEGYSGYYSYSWNDKYP